jgi:hypothetical protein
MAQTDTAANVLGGLDVAGQRAYGASATPAPTLVGNLISALLGLSGLILVGLLIYGGILYMTAQGDMDRVKQAKKTMVNAVIGIVIVVASYAAASFIIAQLTSAVNPTAGTTQAESTCTPDARNQGLCN